MMGSPEQQSYDAMKNNEASALAKKRHGTQRNLFSSVSLGDDQQLKMSALPLKQVQQCYDDAITNSTKLSSAGSNDYTSEMDDLEVSSSIAFDASPVMFKQYSHVHPSAGRQHASLTPMAKPAGKMENGWKKKVKTELCRFWLNGQDCENSQKEQGCGFAHG